MRRRHMWHRSCWLARGLLLLVLCGLAAGSSSTTTTTNTRAQVHVQRLGGGADDAVFTSGEVLSDTSGQPVSAHEGWIMSQEDAFLWYGMGEKHNASSGGSSDWVSDSILLYTSNDLSSWKKRGTVFSADAVPPAVAARLRAGADEPLRLERPKVLYSASRRYYVLLFHIDNIARTRSEVGWAVSVSPYGPFNFEAARQPSGVPSWDITVATDGASTAWLAHAVPDGGIAISQLASDFLDTTGVCARVPAAAPTHAASLLRWQAWGSTSQPPPQPLQLMWRALARVFVGPAVGAYARLLGAGWAHAAGRAAHNKARVPAAAPCLFQYRNKWYLLAAERPGWQPSKLLLHVNDGGSPCNESAWRQLPSPVQASSPGVHSIPAFVLPYAFQDSDKVQLIYYGDRYDPLSPANATYAWQPMLPAADGGDGLQLLSLPSWRLSDYRGAV